MRLLFVIHVIKWDISKQLNRVFVGYLYRMKGMSYNIFIFHFSQLVIITCVYLVKYLDI